MINDDMEVSMNGGTPWSLDGLFHGKSQSQMDDDWGTHIFGTSRWWIIRKRTTHGEKWWMMRNDAVSFCVFFPTCQVRVVRFYVGGAAPPPSSFFLLLPRRTSSASSWSQWASPDLICQLLIAVGLAGPHLPALDRRKPRRISSASSW